MRVDRMSSLDASFLHIEDGVSHMHIASVGIFSGPVPPFFELQTMIESKLSLVPRYRCVVRNVPFELGRPVWVDDPHFNIEYHVRHTALPSPGGEDELRKLVGRVMSQPLDRSKPLWEIWVVEGLDEGNWAVLSKTHHALVDGVSGTDLLAVIMDLSPDQQPLPTLPWEPSPSPSAFNLAVDASLELMRSPYEQLNALRHAVSVPRQALEEGVSVLRGLLAMTGLAQTDAHLQSQRSAGPPSALWMGLNHRQRHQGDPKRTRRHVQRCRPGRHHQWVSGVASVTGGVGGSGRTNARPVSVRPRSDSGLAVGDGTLENKVSAMFAELPVSIADAPERLHAVSRQMAGVKDSRQAVAGEALTSMTGFAPPMLLALGMRVSTRMAQHQVNTVTTNVPGPQIPLYMGGRQMIRAFPYVPLGAQMRIGIAIFSYNGEVSFGVTGDYDTSEDLDVLCRGIEEGIRQMRKTDV